MKITIEIDDKRITDLLHGHGGSVSPWMHELTGEWTGENGCAVKFDREEDEEGGGKGEMTVQRADVERGMALFPKLAPHRFSDFMGEDDDDLAFDCVWQCIIFGKLVYG